MHSFEKRGITYTVIDKIDDYTIIHRDTIFKPWVVAYGFDEESDSWSQGDYCDTLENAIYTALKNNFWSKDWILNDGEFYLIAFKKEDEGKHGLSPEEWIATTQAMYDAETNTFSYMEYDEILDISETEILAVIPIADPDYLLD